ncbi:uncharacterized protein HKW66_Vig0080670 [Vigna angularis]|uniref:Uncharacterized protein n=1 Tax=Phaseolus angularis TaxID=3914 RepID=A0A8T0KIZ1_PHAAN|nr:uncharacterized protein HKW66_Vig0080670 [Vigna angularis]
MFKLFKEEVDCHTRRFFDTIDVSVHNVYEELQKRIKGDEVADVITVVLVTNEEMSTDIVKEALDSHHNARVKDNFGRKSLGDIVAKNKAFVAIIVDHEASIAKLEKVVDKLQMFLAQKRQQGDGVGNSNSKNDYDMLVDDFGSINSQQDYEIVVSAVWKSNSKKDLDIEGDDVEKSNSE